MDDRRGRGHRSGNAIALLPGLFTSTAQDAAYMAGRYMEGGGSGNNDEIQTRTAGLVRSGTSQVKGFLACLKTCQ